MMKPNAKLIASRSASVTAGTALPASVSVAITEPGPTRTNAAVPNVSAIARCDIECMVADPLNLTSVRQCRIDFTNRSPARVVCQQAILGCETKVVPPGFGLVSSWQVAENRRGFKVWSRLGDWSQKQAVTLTIQNPVPEPARVKSPHRGSPADASSTGAAHLLGFCARAVPD